VHPEGRAEVGANVPDLAPGPGVLPVLVPDVRGVADRDAVAPAEVGVGAADGVTLGEEDGVRGAVGDGRREAGHAADLPVLVPAAAEDVPVGRVAGQATRPAVIAGGPARAVGRQGRVAGGLVRLDLAAPVDPPGVGLVAGVGGGAGVPV